MATLFPMLPSLPAGFRYQPDFISSEEEKNLVGLISKIPLHPFRFHGYEAKRQVASFGYDYSFEHRALTKGKEIPEEFLFLIKRSAEFLKIQPQAIAELLITYYPGGAVINWHRDAPPFDLIAGISMNSDCQFKLRPHEKQKQARKSIVTLTIERRSLYCIQGEARTAWEHSISPVDFPRYSITLRTLR